MATKTKASALTFDQARLKPAIDALAKNVPSRPSHPILESILFCPATKKMSAFDLTIALSLDVEFEGDASELTDCCIPAKQLQKCLEVFNKGDVAFKFDENLLHLVQGKTKFKIAIQGAAEYPELPKIEHQPIAVSTAVVERIAAMASITSKEDSKGVIRGINLSVAEGEMIVIATDGHRLHTLNQPQLTGQEYDVQPVTIPRKAIEMVGGLSQDEGKIRFSADNNGILVKFSGNNWTLTSRTLEGRYPDVATLIPRQFTNSLTCNKKELLQALNQIAVITNTDKSEIGGVVKITLGNSEMHFQSNRDSDEVEASIAIEYEGDEVKFAVSAKYLTEAITAQRAIGDKVTIHFNSPIQPIVLHLWSESGEDKTSLALVMPIRVKE